LLNRLLGYQTEAWVGLTGTAFEVEKKRELIETQVRFSLNKANHMQKVEELEFQL
jgi:hypothetical protein